MDVEILKCNSVSDDVAEFTQVLHKDFAELVRTDFRYLATCQDDAVTITRLERSSAASSISKQACAGLYGDGLHSSLPLAGSRVTYPFLT